MHLQPQLHDAVAVEGEHVHQVDGLTARDETQVPLWQGAGQRLVAPLHRVAASRPRIATRHRVACHRRSGLGEPLDHGVSSKPIALLQQ